MHSEWADKAGWEVGGKARRIWDSPIWGYYKAHSVQGSGGLRQAEQGKRRGAAGGRQGSGRSPGRIVGFPLLAPTRDPGGPGEARPSTQDPPRQRGPVLTDGSEPSLSGDGAAAGASTPAAAAAGIDPAVQAAPATTTPAPAPHPHLPLQERASCPRAPRRRAGLLQRPAGSWRACAARPRSLPARRSSWFSCAAPSGRTRPIGVRGGYLYHKRGGTNQR